MCKKPSFQSKVKESIDFIYNLTTEQPDGYRGGFATFDNVTKAFIPALVKRGVVSKEQDRTKERTQFVYKWVPAMAPNKTLYGNIAEDIRKSRREHSRAMRDRKAEARKAKAEQAVVEPAEVAPLASFSTKELWEEIKRRGYSIEDNRLVIVRKEYLE